MPSSEISKSQGNCARKIGSPKKLFVVYTHDNTDKD